MVFVAVHFSGRFVPIILLLGLRVKLLSRLADCSGFLRRFFGVGLMMMSLRLVIKVIVGMSRIPELGTKIRLLAEVMNLVRSLATELSSIAGEKYS